MARRHRHARQGRRVGARPLIKRATGLAEASLTQPGQPALDPKTFEGETITKDVVVAAKVKTPDGADGRQDADDHDRARRRHARRHEARRAGRLLRRSPALLDGLSARLAASRTCARSVFVPTDTKRTTSFWSSSRSSTLTTVPTPNCACFTRAPGRRPGVWSSSSYVKFCVGDLAHRGSAVRSADSRAAVRDSARYSQPPPRVVASLRRLSATRLLLDQIGGNLVEEPRRLGVLVLAEDAAAGGAGEHQLACARG